MTIERHANALAFAIGKLEAGPHDIPACKAVCWFVCRLPYDSVREKALEAIKTVGDVIRELAH